MNYPNSAIFFSIFITNSRAIIWAAVIYENQFEIRERLRKNAVHATMKVLLHFINRYDYANFGQGSHFL